MSGKVKLVIVAIGCLLICLAIVFNEKKPTKKHVTTGVYSESLGMTVRVSGENTDWLDEDNPTNLHVRVRNTGTRTLSDLYLENGKAKSPVCQLAPSSETEHIFRLYSMHLPLRLYYMDDQQTRHIVPAAKLYEMTPESIRGNFDLTFYVNSTTNETVILNTDEQ